MTSGLTGRDPNVKENVLRLFIEDEKLDSNLHLRRL